MYHIEQFLQSENFSIKNMTNTPKTEYRKFCVATDALDYSFSYNTDETAALHQLMNEASTITIDHLRRISLWKLNRVMHVSDALLQKLLQLSQNKTLHIDDAIAREVIEDLSESQGIGFPMASSILKFIRPDVFPIIDVRAYRALHGRKIYYASYTYEKYIEYAKQLIEIAALKKIPLKEVDEQLYCFDVENNGKI